MKWEPFEEMLGTWAPKIKPFFDREGFDPIYAKLKSDSKVGRRTVPNSGDVFRCFRETPLDTLKAVLCGYCPYHSMKDGEPIADGLAMGCSKTGVLQPSLVQFYNALETEFNDGLCLKCERDPDLSYLAHQGVLLFNSALTTRAGTPGEHQDLWAPFTKFVFSEIIGDTGVPVVFLGQDAAVFEGYLGILQPSFSLPHPVSASYREEKWDSKGTFKAVNEILKGANNEEILWHLEPAPF